MRPQRLKSLAWRAAFPRWPRSPGLAEGYTLLLPVPADLPVFLHLALANAQLQDGHGRAETIVVPDTPTAAFRGAFAVARERFDVGVLRLVELGRRARAMQRLAATPGANHFMQLHAGACAAGARHVLLHDADLFIEDPAFMRRHYELALRSGAGCVGVSPAWDDWLREHSLSHVVATWELMADLRWLRSFAPWQHRPHVERLDGELHLFDLTLYPQAVSPAGTCRLHEASSSFEHFNYVISVYRHFQRARAPFEDYRFLLLLVRLLSDAYGTSAADLPTMADLVAGISDAGLRVTYTDPETAGRYAAFRAQLQRILDGPLLAAGPAQAMTQAVGPFDRAFAS